MHTNNNYTHAWECTKLLHCNMFYVNLNCNSISDNYMISNYLHQHLFSKIIK